MIYKRGRFYSVKFKFQGKLIRRSTRAMLLEDARAIEAKIRSELALGNWDILKPKPSTLTLREREAQAARFRILRKNREELQANRRFKNDK